MNEVVLLLMSRGAADDPLVRAVTAAREAAVLDTVEKAMQVPAIGRIVVATASQRLRDLLAGYPVVMDMDVPGQAFHFGQRLASCIARHGIARVVYLGAGSGVLLPVELLARLANTVAEHERCLLVNNFFSSDFAAWTPAGCLNGWPLPEHDNALGWLLGENIGLPVRSLERNAATQFDIDTPIDLLVVRDHPAVGAHLRRCLDALPWDTSRLEQARAMLATQSLVIVAGRIGAETWGYLERETSCRIRVFAEERGMRSDGRLQRNEARSVLGFLLERTGLEAGFALLAQLGQAAFIDSRVLWAHFSRWPSAVDRFRSDLGLIDEIEDPWLKEFTSAALAAPIPIVLGGHSLVSGGMYVLAESLITRDASATSAP